MNSDQENFDSLKKLLALKRHEQPPPGYFNELPRKIWSRIEAEEMKPSLWKRLFPGFALKPSVAYAFGLLVCGTLIIGIGSSLNKTEQAAVPTVEKTVHQRSLQTLPAAVGFNQENDARMNQPMLGSGLPTNPLFTPQPFYPGPTRLQVEPAAYNPGDAKP